MPFEVKFTNDPEFNSKHSELIHELNITIRRSIHQLYDEGMSIEDILVAVPVTGITIPDLYEILSNFWYDSRCRITKDNLEVGMVGEFVTGGGVVESISRNGFHVRYNNGRLYNYRFETLKDHLCLIPHSYFTIDGSVWQNGVK